MTLLACMLIPASSPIIGIVLATSAQLPPVTVVCGRCGAQFSSRARRHMPVHCPRCGHTVRVKRGAEPGSPAPARPPARSAAAVAPQRTVPAPAPSAAAEPDDVYAQLLARCWMLRPHEPGLCEILRPVPGGSSRQCPHPATVLVRAGSVRGMICHRCRNALSWDLEDAYMPA